MKVPIYDITTGKVICWLEPRPPYPLIDTWNIPMPEQSILIPPRMLTNEELLDSFEDVVSCNTYCPVKCTHDCGVPFSDLHAEILRRMELGERYETLSD